MLTRFLDFLHKYLDRKYLALYILIIDIFLITFLIILCLGSTLTADDYQFFALVNTQHYSYLLLHYGSEISGRYSYAFIIITSIKLLKLKALSIVPIASLMLLLIGAVYSVVSYLRIVKKTSPLTVRLAIATTLFAVIASLVTAPSIFDTFVWFSAAPVYILSFAVLFVMTGLTLRDLPSMKRHRWLYPIVFFLGIVAAGFLEVIPIELVVLGLTGIFLTINKRESIVAGVVKNKLRIYSFIFLISGVIGGTILRLSPWTSIRVTSGKQYAFGQMIQVMFSHLQIIPQYIFSWRVLFSIIIGILLFLCIGKVSSLKNKLLLLFIISIVLIVVPTIIVGGLAAVSGLTEANGMASNRLLYDSTSGVMLGIALLVYIVVNELHIHSSTKLKYVAYCVLFLSLFVGLGYGVSSLSKVTQAVYVKKSMFEFREAVIASDLASHRPSVRIVSASILLPNSQIEDIGFGSPVHEVWERSIRTYYNIPSTIKLDFTSVAPAGYCTTGSESVTYGKQTCAQIVNSANSLTYTTYP
jgi:hypothetical protein